MLKFELTPYSLSMQYCYVYTSGSVLKSIWSEIEPVVLRFIDNIQDRLLEQAAGSLLTVPEIIVVVRDSRDAEEIALGRVRLFFENTYINSRTGKEEKSLLASRTEIEKFDVPERYTKKVNSSLQRLEDIFKRPSEDAPDA